MGRAATVLSGIAIIAMTGCQEGPLADAWRQRHQLTRSMTLAEVDVAQGEAPKAGAVVTVAPSGVYVDALELLAASPDLARTLDAETRRDLTYVEPPVLALRDHDWPNNASASPLARSVTWLHESLAIEGDAHLTVRVDRAARYRTVLAVATAARGGPWRTLDLVVSSGGREATLPATNHEQRSWTRPPSACARPIVSLTDEGVTIRVSWRRGAYPWSSSVGGKLMGFDEPPPWNDRHVGHEGGCRWSPSDDAGIARALAWVRDELNRGDVCDVDVAATETIPWQRMARLLARLQRAGAGSGRHGASTIPALRLQPLGDTACHRTMSIESPPPEDHREPVMLQDLLDELEVEIGHSP